MVRAIWWSTVLGACTAGGKITGGGDGGDDGATDSSRDTAWSESDADTDADTDSDTDADTDADADPDFSVGELLVNEFLANSHPVADETGEWIEFINLSDRNLELKGLVIGDLDPTLPQSVEITGSVVVPAKGFVVIGNSTDSAVNGGVSVAWAWDAAAFQLGNDGDEIVIGKGSNTYDSVAYEETAWGMVKGVSVQRDARRLDVGSSSDASAWCAGTSTFGSDAQVGTPNTTNDSCVR